MKFLVINGPNLNRLGSREPDIYGTETHDALKERIIAYAEKHNSTAEIMQSNHEGEIIDALQVAEGKFNAIILNPGAYTHYSYAIYDALKACSIPAMEVHLSNIQMRDAFRQHSVTAPACVGQISGLGFKGYMAAMAYFLNAYEV